MILTRLFRRPRGFDLFDQVGTLLATIRRSVHGFEIETADVPVVPLRDAVFAYTDTGDLLVKTGVHLIQGNDIALALAAPTAETEGVHLWIFDDTDSHPTVVATAFRDASGVGNNIATFNAKAGSALEVIALRTQGGQYMWYVVSSRNVSFSF